MKRIEMTRPLPSGLRRGMERLTGVKLHNVRVHYNSRQPGKVDALAYAQGLDIYLSSGQERHLPHELGHVVQQIKGMVVANTSVNGLDVNDDPRLEKQATVMGNRANWGG